MTTATSDRWADPRVFGPPPTYDQPLRDQRAFIVTDDLAVLTRIASQPTRIVSQADRTRLTSLLTRAKQLVDRRNTTLARNSR